MKISRKSCLKSGVRRASVVIKTNMAENEIERLSENERDLEDDLDSVSVSSAEPDNLEDVEGLANEVFGESEDKDHEFHGFYNDETVRQIFGDSDDEAEPFAGFSLGRLHMGGFVPSHMGGGQSINGGGLMRGDIDLMGRPNFDRLYHKLKVLLFLKCL